MTCTIACQISQQKGVVESVYNTMKKKRVFAAWSSRDKYSYGLFDLLKFLRNFVKILRKQLNSRRRRKKYPRIKKAPSFKQRQKLCHIL
jgi:hypothetical protein